MERHEPVKSRQWIAWILFWAFIPYSNVRGMDSTNVVGANAIPILTANSILGSAENNKLCSYRATDKKIHCLNNQEGASEYKVTEIRSPIFPRFQSQKTGNIGIRNNTKYGFLFL